MAEALAKKKKIRSGHRASATRMVNRVGEMITAVEADPTKELDVNVLLQLKLSLDEKLSTLKQLDGEILELVEDEAVDDEIEQADAYKERVYAATVNIDKHCTPVVASRTPDRTRGSPVLSREPTDAAARVRLPKLAIRPFNGDITTWTTFWDSFESAINSNTALTAIDKFNYLRSLVERSAAEAISGLTLTADNYKEAVSILKKRFGNKQQIITKHMDILLGLEPVTSQHKLRELRHLFDIVEAQVRGLKSLGVESASYGSLLTSVLLQKLPLELRLIVSREVEEADWNLDELLKQLEREIEARERAAMATSHVSKRQVRDTPSTGTTATFLSPSSTPHCSYCQQVHFSSECGTVTNPDERKQILRRSGRCFICLKKFHVSKDCRSSNRCRKCGGRHHTSICTKGSTRSAKTDSKSPEGRPTLPHVLNSPITSQPPVLNPQADTFVPSTTAMCADNTMAVLLQTARADVYSPMSPQSVVKVRLLLDNGSQRSYVTNCIQEALALPVLKQQKMLIKTFGSAQEEERECDVVRIGLRTVSGVELELSLFSVPLICEPLSHQPISLCKTTYNHLVSLDLADLDSGGTELPVDILIGSDHYWKIVTGEVVRGESGPIAIGTHLGWVLSGPTCIPDKCTSAVNVITAHTLKIDSQEAKTDEGMDVTLQQFWDLESLGIKGDEASTLENFDESIVFKDGRYEVCLPWKETHPTLPDHYELSKKRLFGLLHRLKQRPSVLQDYDATIKDQLSRGIVEEVNESDQSVHGTTHYIPHHAVIRQDKSTTKLRVVYNASAKQDGPSLNDCLYSGPKFGQNIMDIILRFRVHKVALAADIEKAFLMVSIAEKDRDVLRFLWIDDIMKDPKIITLRFKRVMFGVSSSPFLLNATIRHHLKENSSTMPGTVARISRSIYVDDLAYGADNEDQAYNLYLESKSLLKSGGFNLRKFVTNSTSLQKRINKQEVQLNLQPCGADQDQESYTKSTLGSSKQMDDGEQKILGIRWSYSNDCLLFDMNELASHASKLDPTKRGIVGIASRVYDPVGFVSPVTIRFKVLFQELCEAKVDWDEPLPLPLLNKWRILVSSLQQGVPLTIPRCYFESLSIPVTSCRLVGFCDASKAAYAAVVYILTESESGCSTQFVACKTRIAPVKEQTIPRLELLSALLLSKLMTSVSQALSPELLLGEPSYFTDSKVALYWIKGQEKEWKPFVQNRVNQIRSLTQTHQWAHCAGKENPADIPSRGIAPRELIDNQLWLHGPSWLHSEIPDAEDQIEMPELCRPEQKNPKNTVTLLVTGNPINISSLIKCENFSSKERLFRVTAYVLRFVKHMKQRSERARASGPITPEELHQAESYWLKESQSLLSSKPVFKIWQGQFGLFQDELGVWRCRGRLSNADLPFATKHPVFLDSQHYLTTLIVRDAHARIKHNGVSETLTELRDKYWIVRGRSFVRKVLHKCVTCRRFEGRPHYPPPPPPLPAFRVKEAPAFTHTGVDYAGPLYIKSSKSSRESKVWVCLYTCCVVRAIHLEVVPDLTAQSFIRCFKRFTTRRGFPAMMVSDNGTTFKAASKMLQDIVKHPGVEQSLSRIQWVFNLEKAPWWGGLFERMVRSVKRCLRKTIGRGRLTLDELQTALAEVEMIVNSRPLSYVSMDSIQEPITPSHLMTGRRLMSLPDGPYNSELSEDVDVVNSDISKRMIHLNSVLEHFWRRWKKEYLLELRESHRHTKQPPKESYCCKIAVGDMVLVHEDGKPRGFWKLAKVESLITGTDGRTRGAVIKVASSESRPTLLRRPLQLLYPLEVHRSNDDLVSNADGTQPGTETAEDAPSGPDNNCGQPESEQVPRRRSRRIAAKNAREIIRIQTEDSEDS